MQTNFGNALDSSNCPDVSRLQVVDRWDHVLPGKKLEQNSFSQLNQSQIMNVRDRMGDSVNAIIWRIYEKRRPLESLLRLVSTSRYQLG